MSRLLVLVALVLVALGIADRTVPQWAGPTSVRAAVLMRAPAAAATPTVPGTSTPPGRPTASATPGAPGTPTAPGTPSASATPTAPGAPSASATPTVPSTPTVPGTPTATGFGWPLPGVPTVTRGFSPPPQPWLAGHRGVDLAGTPGGPVLAAGSGRVAFAGIVAGLGVVSVDHPDGLRTTYEPVTPKVRRGQLVERGSVLGSLLPGHPGCPVVACLHWGLRTGATYLDPLSLLSLAPVRLLPLDGAVDA